MAIYRVPTSATSGPARDRPRTMTTGRAFRSAGSTWSPTLGPTSTPPFHRYADGKDLSELSLTSLADLPAVVVRRPWEAGLATDASRFDGLDVRGKAVLVHTGWDRHWRTDAYGAGHPFLTGDAADWLVSSGAALVGIDSYNIDNTSKRTRPVHSKLLAADIPICEHMAGLGSLPGSGFRFSAVPPKVRGMGTFPVRAYAVFD